MAITYTFEKLRVLTDNSIEGYSDVVSVVDWKIVFTDGTYESIGLGKTYIDVNDLSSFTAISEVTDDMLEQWVIEDEFGPAWGEFVAFHEDSIVRQKTEASLTVHYQSDDYS